MAEITKQEINEIVANVPEEIQVASKILRIHSKSINRMTAIDKLISQLQAIGQEGISDAMLDFNAPPEEFEKQRLEFQQRAEDRSIRIIDKMVEILFNILNDDIKNPEITTDWIRDNIDVTEGGIAEQIMDAYNKKCNPGTVIKKMLASKKFY